MDVLVVCGGGLDVHKKTVVACVLDGRSTPPKIVKRTFGTFRYQLEQLREWLLEAGCTHVAMESTGVYWWPVYRVLEGHFTIVLGNARHMANIPGRKTDLSDSEWIATLLIHGLIRPNFVPPRPIRELRQVTRYRRKLIQGRSSAQMRVDKLLEATNIKISSVASELFGVSGRRMLTALASGINDPIALAGLSCGKLRKKRPQLIRALSGTFTPSDAALLSVQLRMIDEIESTLLQLEPLIEEKVAPYQELIELLDTAPGIDRIIAIEIIAEAGPDLSLWPTEHHFAAWAGVCPGNRESAGKRRRTRSRDGNPYLKTILAQAATSAVKKLGSYLSVRYGRLSKRRGERVAIIAIAREIAIAIYHMLRNHQPYKLPAIADPVVAREKRRHMLIRELQKLGLEVTCTPAA